jgi:asparagine N-glycosylation enzyme membrane subunit Stt3
MHFNFDFTTVQIIWTLTFAALLVLLVVLLGRDRTQRFPWFTASIALAAVRLLASRMLYQRLPAITLNAIFIVLANVIVLVGLLVLVEMARRAFAGVRPRTWILWTLALVAVGAVVLATWGPWPAWKTLTLSSTLAKLQLLQFVGQKGDLLLKVLTVELGLLMAVFGGRFNAGWRSHTQQITIGLSTAAIAQLAVQGIVQLIALKAVPHSQAEYEHLLDLRDKLVNANAVVYVAVLVWWIVCLWIDEPGSGATAEIPESETTETETVDAPAEKEDDAEV